MPYRCFKHPNEAFIEPHQAKETDAPICPSCGNNKKVNWFKPEGEDLGVLIKTDTNFRVFVDSHQGKHVNGGWPNYTTGKKGNKFFMSYVSQGTYGTLLELWNAAEPSIRNSAANSGYAYLNCGEVALGTDWETFVTLQWERKGANYTFHAYPEASLLGGKTYINAAITVQDVRSG